MQQVLDPKPCTLKRRPSNLLQQVLPHESTLDGDKNFTSSMVGLMFLQPEVPSKGELKVYKEGGGGPKFRGTFVGAPIARIVVFRSLHLGKVLYRDI